MSIRPGQAHGSHVKTIWGLGKANPCRNGRRTTASPSRQRLADVYKSPQATMKLRTPGLAVRTEREQRITSASSSSECTG
jgi:hypothetical protein